MHKYLNHLHTQKILIDEVEQEVETKRNEFDNIKLDFIVIALYANFEQEINKIISRKLKSKNNFHDNHIKFLYTQNKKLHRGISKKDFKSLLENVFNIERSTIINDNHWNIFCSFMEFRHSIAHCLPNYSQNKENLIQNMKTTDNLINVFESILSALDGIKRIKKKNN